MIKTPTISVVMSAYNDGQYLNEAINSILKQTYKNFKFIIINDASTDDTAKILQDHKKKDPRIIVLDNKTNLGLTKSLNIGLKKAHGRYIARMDADDIAYPDRFAKEVKFLKDNPGIFLVGGAMKVIDKDGKVTSQYKPLTDPKIIRESMPPENEFLHGTIMFRNDGQTFYRDKFRYAQDYDLYLNLFTRDKILANLPDFFMKYRFAPGSVSVDKAGQQALFGKKAEEFYYQRLKNKKDDYAKWDPQKILDLDQEKTKDKFVLESLAEGHFVYGNHKSARKYSQRCLKYHGWKGVCVKYYLASFLPAGFVNFLRKLKV